MIFTYYIFTPEFPTYPMFAMCVSENMLPLPTHSSSFARISHSDDSMTTAISETTGYFTGVIHSIFMDQLFHWLFHWDYT